MYGNCATVFDNISGIIFQVSDFCFHGGGVYNRSNLSLEAFQIAAIRHQIRYLCIFRIFCRKVLSSDGQYSFGAWKISHIKKGVF